MSIEEIIKLEGDYKGWIYKTNNGLSYKCEIKRSELGFLLGYIHLSKDNDFYGKVDIDVSVHGGVTYNNYWKYDIEDFWVIGFDAGHFGDLVPLLEIGLNSESNIYRDMQYITNECNSMAEQISKISTMQLRDYKLNSLLLYK